MTDSPEAAGSPDPEIDAAHFRALERMYHEAPCNESLDPTLSIEAGRATVEFGVDESTHHAAGGMHGSYYFKALDDAAFFAVNSIVEDVFVLTTGFDLNLERPVSGGVVHAEGAVVNANPNQLLATAVAQDGEGREIARGTGRFAKSRIELDGEVGYERREE
jgi:uncharacterized protein (TIGR00369 family)